MSIPFNKFFQKSFENEATSGIKHLVNHHFASQNFLEFESDFRYVLLSENDERRIQTNWAHAVSLHNMYRRQEFSCYQRTLSSHCETFAIRIRKRKARETMSLEKPKELILEGNVSEPVAEDGKPSRRSKANIW